MTTVHLGATPGAGGRKQGLWRAVLSSIADTLYTVSGFILTRTTQAYTAGDPSIIVESHHRGLAGWGMITPFRFIAGGEIGYAAGVISGPGFEMLVGVTDPGGNPGIPVDLRAGQPVMFHNRTETDLDLIRRSFFVEYAESGDLAVLGRNYGIAWPRGLDEVTYRGLLKVMIYLDSQTEYSIEKVMDVLKGPGNYEIWEDLPQDHHIVYVGIQPALGTSYRGKTFMPHHEVCALLTPTTVALNFDPVTVLGVWEQAPVDDPFRQGTNYAEGVLVTTFTQAVQPLWLQGPAGTFSTADEGKYVIATGPGYAGEHWKVRAVVATAAVQLGRDPRHDATLNSGLPSRIRVDRDFFRPWMVGHQIVVASALNGGAYTIGGVIDGRNAALIGAGFVTETDVTWELRPQFGSGLYPVRMPRWTYATPTLTLPTPAPGTHVTVDYTTIPSGQAMLDQFQDGNAQYPFYLWDETCFVQLILDLITAAGVEPRVEILP